MTRKDVESYVTAKMAEKELTERLSYLENTKIALEHPFHAMSFYLSVAKNFRLRRTDIFYLLNLIIYDKMTKGEYRLDLDEKITMTKQLLNHQRRYINNFMEKED